MASPDHDELEVRKAYDSFISRPWDLIRYNGRLLLQCHFKKHDTTIGPSAKYMVDCAAYIKCVNNMSNIVLQWTKLKKSHNAPAPCPIMFWMVHNLGYGTDALWCLWDWSVGCIDKVVAVARWRKLNFVTKCLVDGLLHCNTPTKRIPAAWWRHQMGTFSALLTVCAGNSPVPGEFPTQRPVTQSFDVSFDLRLNKWLSKQSWGRWLETLSRPLRRHRNGMELRKIDFAHKYIQSKTF